MSDLSGTWTIQMRFLRGEAQHSMQIEQHGEELKGVYRLQYGACDLSGTIAGDAVRWRVPVYYESVGATYDFSGTLADGVLSGAVSLGEYGSGEWDAARVS